MGFTLFVFLSFFNRCSVVFMLFVLNIESGDMQDLKELRSNVRTPENVYRSCPDIEYTIF